MALRHILPGCRRDFSVVASYLLLLLYDRFHDSKVMYFDRMILRVAETPQHNILSYLTAVVLQEINKS
jgi:hypothetical protein